jgi:hypothetical protein
LSQSKRLRGEAKEAEAAMEAALLAAAEQEESKEGETKNDDDEEEGKEGEEVESEKKDEFVDDLLGPAASEDAVMAAAGRGSEAQEADDVVRGLPQNESFKGNKDRKQSVQVNMDDVFFRAPSQEALEQTSRLAQERTQAMRNLNTAAPDAPVAPTPAPVAPTVVPVAPKPVAPTPPAPVTATTTPVSTVAPPTPPKV